MTRLDFDVEHLTTAVHSVLRINAVRTECAAIRWILGKFRSDKSVGGAAVGTAAFGLFAFRIGHGKVELSGRGAC
jgi:hypothetical protein